MPNEAKETQGNAEEQSESTDTKQVETKQEPEVKEPVQEKTVAELLKTNETKNSIPEAVFLREKSERKAADRRVKELEAQIAAGATREEVSEDIDDFLDDFGLDDTNKKFFQRLTKNLESRAERKAEEKLNAKLKPIEDKERSEQINTAFTKHFNEAMQQFPDLKEIVNPDVVKAYSLDPRNANKTFTQLIEEAYGGVSQGKRTIETATPRGGKEPEAIDFARASKDASYLETVLKDPKQKAEYNAAIEKRLSRYL